MFDSHVYIVYINYTHYIRWRCFKLNIKISNTLDGPIDEQVKDEIIRLIMSGELDSGDALPSMRRLAKDLGSSIITTKRAHQDLEGAGYADSVGGQGTYVTDQTTEHKKERIEHEIEGHSEAMLLASRQNNLSRAELDEMNS